MAEYQTKSSSEANNVDSLKKDCSSLTKEIGKKTWEIASDFETVASGLDYVASRLGNKNMDEAERLYKDAWFRMSSTTLCKRLWSETELTKWLNANTKTGKIKEFCEKLGSGFRFLKEMKRHIDKIEPIVDVVKAIHTIYSENIYKITINTEKVDRCTVIRNEMKSGVRQFEAVMDIVKMINNFAPRGFKEYIDYNLAVFDGAKKLFKIADNYADVIIDLAKETEDAWNQAFNNDSSWWNATKFAELDMDANSYLDHLNQKRKQNEAQRQYERDRSEILRQRG